MNPFCSGSSMNSVSPAPGSGSGTDQGILAFGTTVSVNDDLRRAITTEIEKIDKDTKASLEQTKKEEQIHEELRKSQNMALKEAQSIAQGVDESCGVLEMNQEMLRGLENTFNAEFSQNKAVGLTEEESKTTGTDGNDEEMTNDNAENNAATVIHGFHLASLQKKHDTAIVELKGMLRTFEHVSEDMVQMARATKDIQSTAADTVAKETKAAARREQLSQQLATAQTDCSAEMKRGDTLRSNLESTDLRLNELEKSKIVLDEEAARFKRELDEATSNFDDHAKANEAEKRAAKKLVEKLENDLLAARQEVISKRKIVQQAYMTIEKRQLCKEQRESIRAERLALTKEREQREEQLATLEKRVETSKHTLNEVESQIKQVEEQKRANDILQAEQILPGTSELESNKQMLEKTRQRVQELSNTQEIKSLKEAVTMDEKQMEQIDLQVAELTKSVADKQNLLTEIQESLKQHQITCDEEVEQAESATKSARKECIALEERIKVAERSQRKKALESSRVEYYNKLLTLRAGASMLRETTKKETALYALSVDK